MITKRQFYFIRHGQTDYNLLGNKVDHADISLNACGKQQAEKIEPLITSLSINSVCFSPLKRAKETKNILCSKLSSGEWEIPHLGECSLEIWQQMTSLGVQGISSSNQNVKIFIQKVIYGINQALNKEDPVLIVSHGGVHFALCCLMNVEEHQWMIDNCIPKQLQDLGFWL